MQVRSSKPIARGKLNVMAALLGVAFLGLASWVLAADAAPTDAPQSKPEAAQWPLFRNDALANGVAATSLTESPELLWKVDGKEHGFEATVAIADGHVVAGCLDGELYVYSLADGKEKWKFHTELGFSAPAAIKDGR